MIDRLMGALPSTSGGTSDFAWLLVWQSTLWLAVGLLAARVWRRRAGRAHLLLVLAMAAAFVSPLLTVIVHRMQWGFLPAPPEPPPVVVTGTELPAPAAEVHHPDDQLPRERADSPDEFAQSELDSMPGRSTSSIEPEVATSDPTAREQPQDVETTETALEPPPAPFTWTSRVTAALAAAWSIASLLLLVRLAISLLAGTRIVRTAREETDPQLVAALGEATRALGLRGAPSLRATPHIRCPMIWCWSARPVVLLPTSATDAGPILWRSVFCHELAHAIRRDHWTALWAEIVVIALPWQPLTWLSRRRLAYLREQACDDWVLSTGGEATDYADSLLQLVPQGAPAHALAAVSSRESLKRRLEHVLSGVRITPKVGRHWLLASTLLALAAIAGVGFAQQGKRAAAPSPEPAPQLETAQETKPPISPAPAATPTASPPAIPSPQPTPAQNPAPALPPGVVAVRGRVLLPNGQPAVGATVRAIKFEYPRYEGGAEEFGVLAALSTDSQGEFRASVNIGSMKEPGVQVNLWATLPGYGLTPYHLAPAEKSGPIEISLVDEEPIRGRILDLQGQPVRDARVDVVQYFDTTTPWVEQWLASARRVTGQAFFNFTREEAKPDQHEPVLRIKSAEPASDVLMPAVKANAEGRFEIKGVGRDRLVDLVISGPRITTIEASILTRPLRPIPFKFHEISGSQFERVAPPSVPVEGVVADEETGKPVPGARIIPTAVERGKGIVGNDLRIAALLSRTSDAQGNYRLQGLETSTTNYYKIVVPDLPYPPVENGSIPVSESLKPIRHNIKLRRGVWAIGRAYDRTNGKPVPGSVYYTPFRSNPAARNYERYRNPPTDFLANYPFGFVDDQGRFKIPVIPGRGVVCLKCSEGNYRPNLGRSEIKELAGSEMAQSMRGPTYERLLSEPFHAVRAVNVTPDTHEIHVDLPVDPGQNVVLKFTDAGGSPLAGLETYGLRLDPHSRMNRSRSSIEGNSATLYASSPDETRTIWIKHRSSGLTKLLHFTPKVGETERTVVLVSPAVVTGRLVTPEAAPLADLRIECVFDSNSADRLPFVKTDAEGRFREELPAGGPFELYCDPFPFAFFAEKLTVVAGEEVDFGQITIEQDPKGRSRPKVHRGPEKRTKPPIAIEALASAPASAVLQRTKETSPKPAAARTLREFRGRVLLPNGRPAAGATVRLVNSVFPSSASGMPPASTVVLATWTADSEGEFAGDVNANLLKQRESTLDLWATLHSFGLAFHPIGSEDKHGTIVMTLAEEEPIRGRIIDLEGRPVRDARVDVLKYFDTTTAAIDQLLSSVKTTGVPNRFEDLGPNAWMSPSLSPSAKTSVDGHFEVRGVGHDRGVYLRVSGPHVATDVVFVLARPMPPIRHRFGDVFGSQVERAVGPSTPAEGFVTDADSGAPIVGVRLEPITWGYPTATTDERGHFRLEGLYSSRANVFNVRVPEQLPYFSAIQLLRIPAARLLEPVRQDLKLKRGIWAMGRAYDRVTGKPVSGTLYYTPFLSNKLAQEIAADYPLLWLGLMECGHVDAEGHLRAVVLPGRGVLSFQCNSGDYRFDFGRTQIKEFGNPKLMRVPVTFAGPGLQTFHTVCEVNVAADAHEAHVDVPVDPGQNITLKFTDPAGHHLAGVETYGLRFPDLRFLPGRGKSFAEGDSVILYATYPEETRSVWFRHRSSGFARVLKFTPNVSETERTIVLEPPAVVKGRVLNTVGTPLSGIKIQCDLGDGWNDAYSEIVTDAQGRFRRDLPPGGPFGVSVSYGSLPRLIVASGEQIDFGDITIDRTKPPTKVQTGAIKRTKAATTANMTARAPASASGQIAKTESLQTDTSSTRALRGRVLLPNGHPAIAATVRVIRADVLAGQVELRVLAKRTTNSNGDFEGHLDATGLKDRRPLSIWAMLPDYGLVVRPLPSISDAQPIVLKLAQEEPIRGRIVDLEGRPVREARVELIRYFDTTTDSIDQWLAAVAKLPRPANAFLDDEGDSARQPAPGGPYLHVDPPQRVSETLVPAVKTDSDGRFELRGLGRDRLIALRVSATRAATIFASVLTRPIKSIPLPQWEVDGSEFTRVVSPSVPVEGFITDEESGKPIAGATVFPYIRSDRGRWRVELGLSASATTDARGHYLLEGLNTQQPNVCGVEPHDLPYLHPWYVKPMETGAGFEVPAAVALRPIRCDVKLKRGIWAVGRASDRVTGKPVSGWVQYTPFRSNEVARKYHVIQGTGGNVEADGRFRLLVVPGRGVLTLYCDEGDYRLQLGREAIADFEKLTSAPYAPYQVVREIDVPPDAEEAHADLAADPGQNVVLKFADPAGKPLAGVEAYGLRYVRYQSGKGYSARPWWSFVESDSATLYATFPGETRTVWLKHRASGLTKLFRFTPKEGETERTIVLEPPAVITARFLTPEGTPLANWSLTCTPAYNLPEGLRAASSDAQGRLRSEIPAGLFTSVFVTTLGWTQLEKNLKVAAGEQIDFGDVTVELDARQRRITKITRGSLKRSKSPGVANASTVQAPRPEVHLASAATEKKPAPTATTTRELRGRVLLPNGQPAVGATVRAMTVAGWPRSWPEAKGNLLGTFSTNAEGRFEGKIRAPLGTRPEWATRRGSGKRGISVPGVDVDLWATLSGYGVALFQLGSVEANDQIVMNLAEEEPIRGHLTNLEGRPIRDCRVEILRYTDLEPAAIDPWLTAVQGVKPEYRNTVVLATRSSEWIPDGIVVPVKGDADGRFKLKGIGRDRQVTLRISGPQSTTILAYVLTRPIKPIQFKYFEISGSQFERIVAPSVPVEGFVTDIETGKPIPGARIFPTAVWRDLVVQDFGAYVSAITDPRGHYRLEGLETVTTNEISVRVPNLPYPQAYEILVPPAKSADPIRQDIKLRHGVWAAGRAYDRTTDKPVSGIISYTPFRSNKFAAEFDHQSNFARNDIVGTADASGHFRVLVIPGRGVVCLQCGTGEYRFDFGKAAIKDLASDSKSKSAQRPTYLPLSSAMYHSMREIDVAADAQDVRVDLPVDPGVNVLLKFVDVMRKPLAGVDTYGLHFPDPRLLPKRGQSFVEGDSATLYATYPEESRHVWLRHRASGLTKLLQFSPKPGETDRTIIFEPPAVVTGRLVSPDGAAISGVPVSAYGVVPGAGWPTNLMSDLKGKFRVEFPAGGPFSLHSQWTQLVRELTVEAGECVDLGDITIEGRSNRAMDPKVHRGPEKRTKPHAEVKATTASVETPSRPNGATNNTLKPLLATKARELRGRVLLPNGQPAVGATVRAIRGVGQPYPAATDVFTLLTTLSADAKGEFRGSVDVGPMTDRRDSVNLWATLAGYGLALHPVLPAEKTDAIVMNLVDDEPIRGHIIDLEGRPLRDVRVEVVIVYDSTAAWVDQFIASAKDKPVHIHWFLPNRSLGDNRGGREEATFRVKSVASVSEALIPPHKTNADGRFEIQGIGRDRHVYLKISGPRMATFVASVVTRPIKPIPFRFHETLGSQFEHVASPSVPVEGFVTDEETGQPIPGVGIRPYGVKRGDSTLVGGNMFVSATSDPKGHFRLEGLDTGRINVCRILIPDLPYLPASEATIPASVSLEPIRLDIKLKRAIWAVGRAYDRSTGNPVSGSVVYTPFRSNEFAAKYFAGQPGVSTNSSPGAVGPDGRFRVPVIPGRGVVGLDCTQGNYRFNLGWAEIKELVDAKRKRINSPTLSPIERYRFHSLREIDVAPHAHEVNVDLPVEPGQNVVLKFRDAVGKPLSGVEAVGLVLDPRILPPRSFTESDSATLCGTYPGDKRTVRLRHRASGLTRLIDFTPLPGETERTIVLEPPAVVTGRLVSEDGAPLSNVKIECFSLARSPTAITEADGHFRFEFPAGGPFELKARVVAPGDPVAVKLTVAAGEQIDLGTITIERGRMDRGFPKVHRGAVKRTKPPAAAKATTASVESPSKPNSALGDTGNSVRRDPEQRTQAQPTSAAKDAK